MIQDILHLKNMIETGYMFDFTKILSVCLNLFMEKEFTLFYSEDFSLEFVFKGPVLLNAFDSDCLLEISYLCMIEHCLTPLSKDRFKTTLKNGLVSIEKSLTTLYNFKVMCLYENYPLRRKAYSFIQFSNDIQLLFKVYQFVSIKTLYLVHKSSQNHITDSLVVLDTIDSLKYKIIQFKVEKFKFKRECAFAFIHGKFIDISRSLNDIKCNASILFISTHAEYSNDAMEVVVGKIVHAVKDSFKSQVIKKNYLIQDVPGPDRLVSGSSFKIFDKHSIKENPAHCNDHMFMNHTIQPSISNNSKLEYASIKKYEFKDATVITQLDKKFILFSVVKQKNCTLYCIDQHAADERIRLEGYMADYFYVASFTKSFTSDLNQIQLKTLLDAKSIIFKETKIKYEIESTIIHFISAPRVLINAVNTLERLMEILMRYITMTGYTDCVMPTLQSIACRSAIMFGDYLSLEDCQKLIQTLKTCKNPFVCAHGRPSVVPLSTFKTH